MRGSLGHEPELNQEERDSVSEYLDDTEDLSGFDQGETMEDVLEEVLVYVQDRLSLIHQDNPENISILMDNIPPLGIYNKYPGQVSSKFKKGASDIKPETHKSYICFREWWKMIEEVASLAGWSIKSRVLFLGKTGGLAEGVKDDYRDRVKNLIEDISIWLPRKYNKAKSERDNRYWLYLWMDVGIRLIEEFHTALPPNLMEEGLMKMMKLSKYKLDAKEDDFLNSQFYKVDLIYKAIYKHLREQSSSYASSPLYVWSLLHRWLESQKPVGPMFQRVINKAVNSLSSDPLSVFNANHRLSPSDIERIKQLGANGATEQVYTLVLDKIKNQALMKELTLQCRTVSELADLHKQIESAGGGKSTTGSGGGNGRDKPKRERGVLSVSTDLSSITNNTTTVTGGKKRYPICKWCRLFHEASPDDKCKFWDEVKRIFRTKAFIMHRGVRVIDKKGVSTVSEYWIKKLKQYSFGAFGVNKDSDREKIIRDLHKAAADLPKATPDEIAKYARESQKWMNLTHTKEEKDDTYKVLLVNECTAQLGVAQALKRDREKARKEAKKSKVEKAKVESDSDHGKEEGSDFSDSEASDHS